MRNTPRPKLLAAIAGLYIALSGTALAVAQDATATQVSGGSVQGRVYSVSDAGEIPQDLVLLAVPSSSGQPLVIESYLGPGKPNPQLEQLPSQIAGPGLVRADAPTGLYSVSGLPAGEYLVVVVAYPFSVIYESLPPEEVQLSFESSVFTARASRVKVTDGSTATVDVVFGAVEPTGPATLTVCANTFNDANVQGPDAIVSIAIDPHPPAITITIRADGCAVMGNVPAGTYTITIKTANGFTLSRVVEVRPGEDIPVNLGAIPPQPGDLPDAGGGASKGGGMSLPVLILGFAVLFGGGLAVTALTMRAKSG